VVALLVIANTMATILAMAFTKQFCKACLVPYYYMIPSVFLFCAIGAYANELDISDLIALVFWSIVGIVMRRYGWPRPPLLIAVVLGPQVQQYLWLSVDRYGVEWLTFPSVMIIGALLVLTIVYPYIRNYLAGTKQMDMDTTHELVRDQTKGTLVTSLILFATFVAMIVTAMQWPLRASLSVYFIAAVGLILVSIQIVRELLVLREQRRTGKHGMPFTWPETFLEVKAWLWLGALALGCYVVGFHVTFLIYPIAFGLAYGANLRASAAIGVVAFGLCWLIFDFFTGAVWSNQIDAAIGTFLIDTQGAVVETVRSWLGMQTA